MDTQVALSELEQIADKLDIEVVYDHFTGEGARSGGLCKVKGIWKLIVEKQISGSEKISVIAKALKRFDLDNLFVSPGVRKILEPSIN